MRYPAFFKEDPEGGYVVTFRDIPEAVTQGDDYDEARLMAADVLESAMDFYFEDGRPVPLPSRVRKGEELVDLPSSVSAKVLLLNEMLATKVSKAELARRMGTQPQEVQRIVDLKHATKIDTVDKALRALGKHLELRLA